jgi:FkbM family methyltransferase
MKRLVAGRVGAVHQVAGTDQNLFVNLASARCDADSVPSGAATVSIDNLTNETITPDTSRGDGGIVVPPFQTQAENITGLSALDVNAPPRLLGCTLSHSETRSATPPPLRRACRAYIRYAPGTLGKKAFIRHLDQALRDEPLNAIARTRFRAALPVTTSDLIQRHLYEFGIWEPHLTAWVHRVLRPGDTFIDVGANIGYYTLLAAHLVGPAGRVVAIEPSPQFRRVLTSAVSGAGYRNIRTVPVAAAAGSKKETFWLEDPANLGRTTMIRPCGPYGETPVFTADARPLAEILTPAELASARVFKIDVEGAEAQVIEGLLPALSFLRPDAELAIEITPYVLAKQGLSPHDVLSPLRAAGFNVYRVPNDYDPASYPAAIRRPQPPSRWDETITHMTDLVLSRTDALQLS